MFVKFFIHTSETTTVFHNESELCSALGTLWEMPDSNHGPEPQKSAELAISKKQHILLYLIYGLILDELILSTSNFRLGQSRPFLTFSAPTPAPDKFWLLLLVLTVHLSSHRPPTTRRRRRRPPTNLIYPWVRKLHCGEEAEVLQARVFTKRGTGCPQYFASNKKSVFKNLYFYLPVL